MADTALVTDLAVLEPLSSLETSPAPAPAPMLGITRRQAFWLTIAALVVYVHVALWIRYGLHYFIGDAISRNYSARMIVFGRRPTLTAMGFYWMPLPALAQVPLVILLEPFHAAAFAGPLSTAIFGALTVRVLCALTGLLAVPRRTALLLVALYAFNPVVIFNCANGMSESASLFFLAVAMYGFFAWERNDNMVFMAMLAFGLAGAMACRYEILVLAPAVALLAGIRRRGLRRGLPTAVVIALPAAFVMAVWMLACKVIKGSWLIFLHGGVAAGQGGNGATAAPPVPGVSGDLVTSLAYCIRTTLRFSPALVPLVPVLLALALRRGVSPIVPVVAAAPFALFQVYLLSKSQSQGDARYFESTVLFVAIATLWWCSSRRERSGPMTPAPFVRGSIGATMLAVGALTGTLSLADPAVTAIVNEHQVFRPALGLAEPDPAGAIYDHHLAVTKAVDAELDAHPGDVLVDPGGSQFELLHTRHPKRFVIDVDLDYLPDLGDNGSLVRYALTADPPAGSLGFVGGWKKVFSIAGTALYEHDVTT